MKLWLMVGLGLGCCASSATAGLYSDDLARCLVTKSTEADKTLLMRWVFGAMTASSATRDLSSVTSDQRDKLAQEGGALFVRLIADTCHAESVAALKYEGSAAFESAFQTLGAVAMRGLMSDPLVAAELAKLDKHMSKDKLKALGKEAGVAVPGADDQP